MNNYNYGQYLRTSIQSAISQTYEKVEVIVVDDGSTDDSKAVIAEFGGQVHSIFKPNGGQASALNAGFLKSSGDLVLFLDSDDWLSPDAIKRAAEAWKPEWTKLHFPLSTIDSHGKSMNRRFPEPDLDSGEVLALLLRNGTYCSPPTSGNLFSREFLSKVLPIPEQEWRGCADCYLVTAAPFFGSIGKLDEPLANYRLHTTSMTGFLENGHLKPNCMRDRLLSDIRKQRLIDSLCASHSVQAKDSSVLTTYFHYKERVASLKMFPEMHPFKSDHLLDLTVKFLKASWRSESLSVPTRVLLSLWALLVVALPRRLAEPLIITAVNPLSRSPLWQSIKRLSSIAMRREPLSAGYSCRAGEPS